MTTPINAPAIARELRKKAITGREPENPEPRPDYRQMMADTYPAAMMEQHKQQRGREGQ